MAGSWLLGEDLQHGEGQLAHLGRLLLAQGARQLGGRALELLAAAPALPHHPRERAVAHELRGADAVAPRLLLHDLPQRLPEADRHPAHLRHGVLLLLIVDQRTRIRMRSSLLA